MALDPGGSGGNGYLFGECTWYVATEAPWVPAWLGDAWMWLDNARADGLDTSELPWVGAVVVYGQGHGYSEFGHVALVRAIYPGGGFLVSEMNFTAWDTVDQRVSSMYGVAGFILPPAGYRQPGGGSSDSGGGGGGAADVAGAWDTFADLWNTHAQGRADELAGIANQIGALG